MSAAVETRPSALDLRGALALRRWVAPAICLALVGLAFVLTWPLFTPNPLDRRWIVAGDFSDQFYPFARYVSDELAARRLPLWNPFVFGGHPFQADPQTAVFYPVSTILALVFGRYGLPYWALELELPIHFAIAAIGTFLFARRVAGSALGAMVAALGYGFGGFLTSYPAQQLAMLRTAAWLPLVLYALDRAIGTTTADEPHLPEPSKGSPPRAESRDWRPSWLVAASLPFGIVLVAGHTQTAMFVAYLALAYAVWRGRTAGLSWAHIGLAAVGPLLLGVGLAAVQLWPTLEFVAVSTRDRLPYDAAAYGYELRALFGALLPGWRGEKALYVGLATLALAAFALRRPTGATLFWAGVALVGLLVSLGGHTFLYRALYLVAPGWSTFRDQERTAAVWSFAIAVLSAYGVAGLQRSRPGDLARWRRWLVGATALAFALAAEVLVLWTARRGAEANPLDSLLDSSVLLVILLALTTALVAFWHRLPAALASAFLVALIVFDLFSVNGGNNLSNVDPAIVLGREAALSNPRAGNEPYRLRADDDKVIPPNVGMIWRAPMMGGDSPIQLRRTHDLLDAREEWRLWQLFNVKYLLSRAERDDPGLERVDRVDDLNVYRVRFSLPRAWAVSDVQVEPDPAAQMAAVLEPNRHPGDVAVVEQPPPLPIAPGLPRPDVHVTSLWPNGIELAVQSTGNALLVVADAWHPGWLATLDGVPTPILRTDYAFRGVAVPAGDHVVQMRYRPRSLLYGGVVSLGCVALTFALVAVAYRRRPRSGRL